jgi:hypothetical protein
MPMANSLFEYGQTWRKCARQAKVMINSLACEQPTLLNGCDAGKVTIQDSDETMSTVKNEAVLFYHDNAGEKSGYHAVSAGHESCIHPEDVIMPDTPSWHKIDDLMNEILSYLNSISNQPRHQKGISDIPKQSVDLINTDRVHFSNDISNDISGNCHSTHVNRR